jgi:hypothetical protein
VNGVKVTITSHTRNPIERMLIIDAVYALRYAAHCFNRAHAQQNGSALIPAGGKLGVM